jgi:hypothetical protein
MNSFSKFSVLQSRVTPFKNWVYLGYLHIIQGKEPPKLSVSYKFGADNEIPQPNKHQNSATETFQHSQKTLES